MARISRTFFAALIGLAFVGSVQLENASAARGWCQVDPVITIDGQLADVFVGSTPAMFLKSTGPIKMEITIPTGSKGTVVFTDPGFLHGYKITFKSSSSLTKTRTHTQVKVSVYAPASTSSLPVTVTFAPRSLNSSLKEILVGTSATGTSNHWVRLTTR